MLLPSNALGRVTISRASFCCVERCHGGVFIAVAVTTVGVVQEKSGTRKVFGGTFLTKRKGRENFMVWKRFPTLPRKVLVPVPCCRRNMFWLKVERLFLQARSGRDCLPHHSTQGTHTATAAHNQDTRSRPSQRASYPASRL